MIISYDEVINSKRFEDNYLAATNKQQGRSDEIMREHCERGVAGEMGALRFIRNNNINCAYNPHVNDIAMACSFDIQTLLYRIEVKTIPAGNWPTFHGKPQFSDNGSAGFDLTTALKYAKADFMLIMKAQKTTHGFLVEPGALVDFTRIGEVAQKSRSKGYYINIFDGGVTDIMWLGDDIIKRLTP